MSVSNKSNTAGNNENWNDNNAPRRSLPFLAVGRVKDATSIASFSYIEDSTLRANTEDIFKKLLVAAPSKLVPSQRTRLQWKEGCVCCLMDSKGAYLYFVVNSFMEYPEQCSYQLLQEFMGFVQLTPNLENAPSDTLTQELRPKMEALMKKYEDPTNVMVKRPSMVPADEARALVAGDDAPPPGPCCCCSTM
eukprot:TRINITY_DN72027_c0_g1_i1.p1 TRINITY_DN72027_c0_g1~~TRINITY_DN72027_c0_g1_i1.p1  ORF type:complete len:192 (-),score=31.36 TRINITY_DN72027_c0_g1_i1:53-628(-)